MTSSKDQERTERLWQEYFNYPDQWWDNRCNKVNDRSPDFRHKNSKESLWIDSWKTPGWVKEALEKKPFKVDGVGNPQSDSRSCGGDIAANAVHKRSPPLNEVREIQCCSVANGNEFKLYETNTLMAMHVKGGSMEDARHVFDNMPKRNAVSWNIMILGYAKNQQGALSLELYCQMQEEGAQPSDRTFVGALKACSSLASLGKCNDFDGKFMKVGYLEKGRAIHSQIVKRGFGCSIVFLGTALLDMYVKCGSMADAEHVFDELLHRDVVSWSVMILGYANNEEGSLALHMYTHMLQEGVTPDDRTFLGILKACSLPGVEGGKHTDVKITKIRCLAKGRAIHSEIMAMPLESNVRLGTQLVDMYVKCGSMEDACHVFDALPHRDVVTWTVMILGCANKEDGALALEMYEEMQQEGLIPDDRTFLGVLKACSSLAAMEEGKPINGEYVRMECLERGRSIFSQLLESGLELDLFLGTALVDMYAKCGSMEDAWHVFDKLPHSDVACWNAMILGYAEKEEYVLALELFAQMQHEGIAADHLTFLGPLKACGSCTALEVSDQVDGKSLKTDCAKKGGLIHFQVVRNGFDSSVFVGTALVDMYAKCGSMEDARHVFNELPQCDVVSWNAMIWGYAEQEQSKEAFNLYAQMHDQGLAPDSATFISILKACCNTAALETGEELHSQICGVGLETSSIVVVALINMYAKCGSMVDAQKLFEEVSRRDVVTWTALIAGYARQGEDEKVFHLFERMTWEGVQPNMVTFLSVLTACSHGGRMDQSHKSFEAMSKQYGILPTIEHYNCIVDLLGRAGRLDEAMMLVEKLPIDPDPVAWMTVLGACCKWQNLEVGRRAFDHTRRLDEKYEAAYVLMSKIYAKCSHGGPRLR